MAEIRQLYEIGPELDFLALRGIYLSATELRKRPASLEALANMIYGPSYVSFEYALFQSGLIPEAVSVPTSATPKRNRRFDTALGCFSYRHLPSAVRSVRSLEARLRDDLRLDDDALSGSSGGLDLERLLGYAARMPGESFQLHLPKLVRRLHG